MSKQNALDLAASLREMATMVESAWRSQGMPYFLELPPLLRRAAGELLEMHEKKQVRAQDTELRGCPICLRIQKWKPGDLFDCFVCGTRLVSIDESFGNR